MMDDKTLLALVDDLSNHLNVEAIALAGSQTTQMNDELSDYDLYIYTSSPIPVAFRQKISSQHCSKMELNNQFWETEDNGWLKSGTEIELIYRDLNWLDSKLNQVIFNHQASTGYSTCIWSNLLNSKILYDRSMKLAKLKNRYNIKYSEKLISAIVAKNLPLLGDAYPAYPRQVSKAVKRHDWLSVQHRLTAYIASYFDVLFAINAVPHPGEKRLVQTAKALCSKVPDDFEKTMENLLYLTNSNREALPEAMALATEKLKAVIPHFESMYQAEI